MRKLKKQSQRARTENVPKRLKVRRPTRNAAEATSCKTERQDTNSEAVAEERGPPLPDVAHCPKMSKGGPFASSAAELGAVTQVRVSPRGISPLSACAPAATEKPFHVIGFEGISSIFCCRGFSNYLPSGSDVHHFTGMGVACVGTTVL